MAKGARVRFEPNRKAGDQLAKSTDMARALERVAGDAADAVGAAAPQRVKAQSGARFYAKRSSEGANIIVKSSMWHWWEYGTRFIPAAPFVRPNVQKVITRYGGRFKSQ